MVTGVSEVSCTETVKFTFADRLWLQLRPTGTGPLVRIDAECESDTEMEVFLEQGRKYLLG
jgi:phosphomannomutase